MFDPKKPLRKHYYAALQLFSEDGNNHGCAYKGHRRGEKVLYF
jgi:hypothetical protein